MQKRVYLHLLTVIYHLAVCTAQTPLLKYIAFSP